MSRPKRTPGFDYLLKYGLNLIEASVSKLDDKQIPVASNLIERFLDKFIDKNTAVKELETYIGNSDVFEMLDEIINMSHDPLPYTSDAHVIHETSPNYIRKKTRSWTTTEDKRLLAAVYNYGLDNWTTVANFVGSGRSRSQCAQRWTRKLDPSICRNKWTHEEEKQLTKLVEQYGNRSWTKIASILGNRSDVQCRYHYQNVICRSPIYPVEDLPHLPLTRETRLAQSSDALRQTENFSIYRNIESTPNFYNIPPPCIAVPQIQYDPAIVKPMAYQIAYPPPEHPQEENPNTDRVALDSFLRMFK